jgi:hypothetical protein
LAPRRTTKPAGRFVIKIECKLEETVLSLESEIASMKDDKSKFIRKTKSRKAEKADELAVSPRPSALLKVSSIRPPERRRRRWMRRLWLKRRLSDSKNCCWRKSCKNLKRKKNR